MFDISIINQGSVRCVIPQGRLDTLNSDLFNENLKLILENEDHLIIDFSKCNYLASTGIRSLISAAKKLGAKGGSLMLASLPAEVFQVLEMAGLHTVFRLFNDLESAVDEVLRLKNIACQSSEMKIENHLFQIDKLESKAQSTIVWQDQEIVGYNELTFAIGIGSPAESLVEEEENRGMFLTIGNCSGFIPFNDQLAPEFRVLKDSSSGGIFLYWALSFGQNPGSRIKLISSIDIQFDQLVDSISKIQQQTDADKVNALMMVDFNDLAPSISFAFISDQEDSDAHQAFIPEQLNHYALSSGDSRQIVGARFILSQMPAIQANETFLDFANRALTIVNIDGVELPDLTTKLTKPIVWAFSSTQWGDAASHRIGVETSADFVFEPVQKYLTRRLYSDSSRVIVKQLHGGYSAQTFQVESYDHDGRKLRPTVLKIANRNMITREADHCQRFSLPYIMNNSAMVLGTAFYCDTGALRYNFVGIGGEQTQLKWLAHYFHSWTTEELEPLFDKIFIQILNPWYGQPVRENIYPYRDQDPTLTFFPQLWKTAEELFTISADEKYMKFDESDQKRINPYWFLKHEYKKRRNDSIGYFTSICHGDLNMQNILLDKEMNVYLIDFSETKPRSVVSDFARLEAIFMIEHAHLETPEDLKEMIEFATKFYDTIRLDSVPEIQWKGNSPDKMNRNLALTRRMRKYAMGCTSGDKNIVPYYLALLEWILPIICYWGVSLPHKKLSAYVAGLLCEKVMECDNNQ